MKTILLNNVSYKLVDSPNISADRIQATILKEDYSFEEIVENAKGNEEITVKEDDTTIGVYSGYTNFLAASLYEIKVGSVVSIELLNADMQSQINNMERVQESQGEAIEALDKKVDNAVNTLGDKAEAADILLGNE